MGSDQSSTNKVEPLSICARESKIESNEQVITLLKSNSQVETIDFTGCRFLNNETLVEVGKICPNLQNIDLNDCRSITDEGLAQFFPICAPLKSVVLRLHYLSVPISDDTIEKLTTKSVDSLTSISFHSSKATPKIFEFLLNCKNLVELNIEGQFLSKESFVDFVVAHKNLEKLIFHVGNNEDIILAAPSITKMRFLHIQGISPTGIRAIADNCSLLEHLNIAHSIVDEDSLLNLCRACANLKVLIATEVRFENAEVPASECDKIFLKIAQEFPNLDFRYYFGYCRYPEDNTWTRKRLLNYYNDWVQEKTVQFILPIHQGMYANKDTKYAGKYD